MPNNNKFIIPENITEMFIIEDIRWYETKNRRKAIEVKFKCAKGFYKGIYIWLQILPEPQNKIEEVRLEKYKSEILKATNQDITDIKSIPECIGKPMYITVGHEKPKKGYPEKNFPKSIYNMSEFF